ncbi:hypothetical protein BKA82DRAFT_997651 [Pisolithus tinctorius]|uniref:Uncharacterized protein n=1 Tax=Pisolithus tinctorius Marx 270 TaxID=870435 RepID=A0A0C3PHK7_PISTI|nr:hypothetical protein BKA82DRAFT_997651 [Pisolithus tinctorius]KIO07951.1 hypothetical protein M404DRAFT_997651 [Pisolithus tinctorius Marx 270]
MVRGSYPPIEIFKQGAPLLSDVRLSALPITLPQAVVSTLHFDPLPGPGIRRGLFEGTRKWLPAEPGMRSFCSYGALTSTRRESHRSCITHFVKLRAIL